MSFDPEVPMSSESDFNDTGAYDGGQEPSSASTDSYEHDPRLDPYAAEVLRDFVERQTTPLRQAAEDYALDREISRIAKQFPDFAANESAILNYAVKAGIPDLKNAYHAWKGSRPEPATLRPTRPEAKTVDEGNRRRAAVWNDADKALRDAIKPIRERTMQKAAQDDLRSRAEAEARRGKKGLSGFDLANAQFRDRLMEERLKK